MKKLSALFGVAMLLTASVTQAQEVNEENPYAMIKQVANQTFSRIKSDQSSIKNDPEELRKIMKEELLPHTDYQFAAFKVLGKHATSVPREKLSEFVKVFREYLITTYAVAMSYYDNQEVIFEPATDVDDKTYVVVRAIIKDPTRPEIKVAFKVRKNNKTNEWKAFDMVAEGISMLDSKRSEFESIIRQQGIDKVIALMEEKIENPLELKKEMEQKKDNA